MMESTRMEPDRLARWRYKDPLSLAEAPALLCYAEPGLWHRDDKNADAAERHTGQRIARMRRDLIAAIEAGELAGHIQYHEYTTGGGEDWITREPTPVKRHRKLDEHGSTIPRADLIAWAESKGIYAAAFRAPQAVGNASDTVGLPGYLPQKAETSLLTIIAALADIAKVDISKPHSNKAASAYDLIAARITALKLHNVSPGTMGKWLAKARDLPREG